MTIDVGVAIVVEMIGVGKMGSNVVTLWMGGDVIWVSEMQFEVTACTEVTC